MKFKEGASCKFTTATRIGTFKGKISIEGGRVFICQNILSGLSCKNKYDYKYSWLYGSYLTDDKGNILLNKTSYISYNIKNLEILEPIIYNENRKLIL